MELKNHIAIKTLYSSTTIYVTNYL